MLPPQLRIPSVRRVAMAKEEGETRPARPLGVKGEAERVDLDPQVGLVPGQGLHSKGDAQHPGEARDRVPPQLRQPLWYSTRP